MGLLIHSAINLKLLHSAYRTHYFFANVKFIEVNRNLNGYRHQQQGRFEVKKMMQSVISNSFTVPRASRRWMRHNTNGLEITYSIFFASTTQALCPVTCEEQWL